jgi:hypothetical protein
MSFNGRRISSLEISVITIKLMNHPGSQICKHPQDKDIGEHLHKSLRCIDSLDAIRNFPFTRCEEIWSRRIGLSEQGDVIITLWGRDNVQICR